MARKATGGMPGRPRVSYPGRDEFVFWTVEWVMRCGLKLVALDYLSAPLSLGRGTTAAKAVAPDACLIAAWLLSGGRSYGDHLTDPLKRQIGWNWRLEFFPKVAAAMDAAGVPGDATFYMTPSSIRDAYQRVKAKPSHAERPSINREDAAERKLAVEMHTRDSYVPGDSCFSENERRWIFDADLQSEDGEGFPPQTN